MQDTFQTLKETQTGSLIISNYENKSEIGNSIAYQMDCMDGLAQTPDKFFDLCIIDPPYGIGEDGARNATRSRGVKFGKKMAKNGSVIPSKAYKPYAGNDKEPPPPAFFKELLRVSKNQIIWGANHFISRVPYDSPCWIVWDKMNGESDFADCELAWTSFKTAARKFQFKWNGMLQGNMKNKQIRIHPNEKPYALYEWLIRNYAKPGDTILDTHMGSQSSRIAAYKLGYDYKGFEIDADYFDAGNKRFQESIAMPLFDSVQNTVQTEFKF